MKICISQNINIRTLLDGFFITNPEVESWLKPIYNLMFQKGITSFDIDEKHLEIYVEKGALNIIYQTAEI